MRNMRFVAAALLTLWPLTATAQAAKPGGTQTGTGTGQEPTGKPTSPPPLAPTPAADAPQPAAEEEPENTGWVGFTDFGVRGTGVNGDPSRFERGRSRSPTVEGLCGYGPGGGPWLTPRRPRSPWPMRFGRGRTLSLAPPMAAPTASTIGR